MTTTRFERFVHTNGRPVVKVTTASGVCFIDETLPVEALIVMRDEIARRYNIPIEPEVTCDADLGVPGLPSQRDGSGG
jgi:hypothetical protein